MTETHTTNEYIPEEDLNPHFEDVRNEDINTQALEGVADERQFV